MNCQDVDVTSCSKKPLCPCFREWDNQVYINEQRVLARDRVEVALSIAYAAGQLTAFLARGAVISTLRFFR